VWERWTVSPRPLAETSLKDCASGSCEGCLAGEHLKRVVSGECAMGRLQPRLHRSLGLWLAYVH
jgi:hypothetical protein